ncbi:hypothetical protein ACO0LF_24570 [Undibacterium sp. Di27W]
MKNIFGKKRCDAEIIIVPTSMLSSRNYFHPLELAVFHIVSLCNNACQAEVKPWTM